MGTQLSPLMHSESTCTSVALTSEAWLSPGLYTLGIEVRQGHSVEWLFEHRSARIQPDCSESHRLTAWIALVFPTPWSLLAIVAY